MSASSLVRAAGQPVDERTVRVALAMLATILVAACGPGSVGPTGSGGPGPSPTGSVGALDHPTGATTVILRLDEGGGLVAPSFFVTQAPAFSLYGDGTVIFRDPYAQPPPPVGQVIRSVPFQVRRLSEDEVQALLAFALGPGGLRSARQQYQLPVADAPTTTFTIVAGGLSTSVSVNGLAVGADGGADAPILTALASLRARLLDFGASVGGGTLWRPDRYRGILIDSYGTVDQTDQRIAWPWPAIQPSDFVKPTDTGGPGWPTRVLTPADVAALGLGGLEGGAQGILLERPSGEPSGTTYELGLRPLLPDEAR